MQQNALTADINKMLVGTPYGTTSVLHTAQKIHRHRERIYIT